MSQNIERELGEQIRKLPSEQRRRVLDFARSLASSSEKKSVSQALLRFACAIERDDLAIIEKVIDEGCETVNPDEW